MVAYVCNTNTREAETGGLCGLMTGLGYLASSKRVSKSDFPKHKGQHLRTTPKTVLSMCAREHAHSHTKKFACISNKHSFT